jgi:hypothetical protein
VEILALRTLRGAFSLEKFLYAVPKSIFDGAVSRAIRKPILSGEWGRNDTT